jgi:hypothetical protein
LSTTSTHDEDEQAKIARQCFQTLQAKVVDLRNAVIMHRANTVIALRRYRQTKTLLAKNEVELKQLHRMLHPDESR